MLLLDGDAGGGKEWLSLGEGPLLEALAWREGLLGSDRIVEQTLSVTNWSRCKLTQVSLSSSFVQVGTHNFSILSVSMPCDGSENLHPLMVPRGLGLAF